MLKNLTLCVLVLFFSFTGFSQCLTALPPPSCNGSEPLAFDGESINQGTSKWYYGATTVMNSLTLNGGTLTVCGNLTVDKFYMDSGTVFIRPGARFVIGSGIGAGLILRGNSSIYNYGTCEIQRNLSLDNGYATAAKPNRVINASPASVFKMSNQYFVINNAFSWFVNNGRADFWGVITDPQSSPGSVCLGNGSATRMAVLINKVANTYAVPDGSACLHVFQYSEFYGRLTSHPSLYACLGSGHTSNSGCIPFGCLPNNWGSAQVFTACSGCAAITALSVQFSDVKVSRESAGHAIEWQMHAGLANGTFTVHRSSDGDVFLPIDTIAVHESSNVFSSHDNNPVPGTNYYMIQYTNPLTGAIIQSKTVKVTHDSPGGISIYPVPFDTRFFINYADGMYPEKIILTDLTGRDIRTRHVIKVSARLVEVIMLDKLPAGIYIVHLLTKKTVVAKTVFKR